MRKIGKVSTTISVVDKATPKLNAIYKSLTKLETGFKSFSNVGNGITSVTNKLNTMNGSVTRLNSKLPMLRTNLNGINTASTTASLSASRLDSGLRRALDTKPQGAKKNLIQLDKETKNLIKSTNQLTKGVRGLASAYMGVMGVRAVMDTSDKLTSAENQLNYMNGGDTAMTQQQMDKIYAASQDSRTDYLDMAKNVGKMMTLAPDAFQGNIDNAIRFQNIMAKTYAISGASAEEQASSMYQLTQALASGKLQGDELRSVNEGATMAYQQIEKFAQELYKTDDALKDMAADGLITSDIVVAAIMNAGEAVDGAFENTQMTFKQMMVMLKNTAIKAFEPFLRKLREIANSPEFQKIVGKVTEQIAWIGDKFTQIGNMIQGVIGWISNNLWVLDIALGVIIFLIGTALAVAIGNVVAKMATFTMSLAKFAMAHPTITLIIVGIIALVTWIMYLRNVFQSTAMAIGYALMFIGMVMLIVAMIGFVMGAAINLPLIVFLALLLIVVGAFLMFTGEIAGAVMWLGATIWNIFVGIVNAILQTLWTMFVEPFIGIIEWILNVCNGGFDSFGGAVANLIGQIISWFLSLGKVVTKIIDAIFGTDWTGGLNSLQDKVLEWGKNDNAITLSRDAPQLQRVDATDAFDTGKQWGDNLQAKIDSFFSSSDEETTEDPAEKLTQEYDPSTGYNFDPSAIESDTENIDKNTGDMSKSMELTEDDLKYLREIANQEAINRFTTAEVRIDMTNNNQVNNTTDLDGIVKYLGKTLKQELEVVANGVY